ncbi:MAG: carboxylating nicotinate-nucleotide diphosphorylase [Candidatus Eiseniibacteriota bacterium]|nr:MAG: carboxylating nicotinate-nucleotide diphosphorylase [Candidatus Eisenbacteria bacterium]
MKLETIATPMVRMALTEDIGGGDITTQTSVAEDLGASAAIFAREGGVLAGLEVARIVFHELDPTAEFTAHMKDGENVAAGKRVCTIKGSARAILTGERVALNFLQRLSGVATLTNRFVRRVRGTGARITDTRKTTPGMRILEKYAVKVGGGTSHRFGLFDMYLVKENHIKAAGSLRAAVQLIKEKKRDIPIEVETKSFEQVKEACECGVDRILLDNMSLPHISKSVEIIKNHRQQMRFRTGQTDEPPKPEIEASGGVTLDNVKEIALTGVEYISVGALTHSFRSIDMSLLIEEVGPRTSFPGA